MKTFSWIIERAQKQENERLKTKTEKQASRPVKVSSSQAGNISSEQKANRIRAFLAERGPAISGQGGHNHTISVANGVMIGFDCTFDETLFHLIEWNETCKPPWNPGELFHKAEDAPSLGGVRGYLLNAPYTPPIRPEEQWLFDIVYYEIRGNRKYKHGPGWACELIEVLPAEPRLPPDLSDLANLNFPSEKPDFSPHPPGYRAPAKMCPKKQTILHYNKHTRIGYEQDHCCKGLDCDFCRPLVKNHWIVSERHHLTAYGEAGGQTDLKPLFHFTITREAWAKVLRALNRKKASIYKVWDNTDAGNDLAAVNVVSTHQAPGVNAVPITPQAAADLLEKLIQQLPATARKGCFRSSRDWKLLETCLKKKTGFKSYGRLDSTDEQREKVREERGINSKYVMGKGRFYPYGGVIYSIGQHDWEHLREELRFGETIFEGDIKWGKKAAADPDDDFDHPAQAPPDSVFAGGFDFSCI